MNIFRSVRFASGLYLIWFEYKTCNTIISTAFKETEETVEEAV